MSPLLALLFAIALTAFFILMFSAMFTWRTRQPTKENAERNVLLAGIMLIVCYIVFLLI